MKRMIDDKLLSEKNGKLTAHEGIYDESGNAIGGLPLKYTSNDVLTLVNDRGEIEWDNVNKVSTNTFYIGNFYNDNVGADGGNFIVYVNQNNEGGLELLCCVPVSDSNDTLGSIGSIYFNKSQQLLVLSSLSLNQVPIGVSDFINFALIPFMKFSR